MLYYVLIYTLCVLVITTAIHVSRMKVFLGSLTCLGSLTLESVECFYFTDEWAFDATITVSLQRKLMCQTLLCGCCYEFHCICEGSKRKISIIPI